MPPMRLKLVSLLFIFSSLLIAQETHDLEIIWVKASPESVWFFGRCVSSGDVNGDSFSDIMIVGDTAIDAGPVIDTFQGKCWIFYGGHDFDTVPDVCLNNLQKLTFWSLHSADINGDGFSDVCCGATNNSGGYGAIIIFLGGNPMDTIYDYILRGPQAGSCFGCAVSYGDVNGDSYDDLIVGAYGAAPRPGAFDMGQVFIYYGGPNFDTIPDVILDGGHNNDQEEFGVSVSGKGDVNDDGFSDVIVGAFNYGTSYQGRIYIYYGGNPMDTIADVAMIGEGSSQRLGWYGVDFLKNNFTYDYAITGCRFWPYGFPREGPGKVYVLFGGNPMDSIPDIWMIGRTDSTGLGEWTASAGDLNINNGEEIVSGAPIEYNDKGSAYTWLGGTLLDTVPDAWLRGVVGGDGIGWNVAAAGDVNGDSKDEVMVSNSAGRNPRVWVCKYTEPGVEEDRQLLTAFRIPLEIKPNPARSVVRVRCPLSVKGIKVYDIAGKIIKTLDIVKEVESGFYEMKWDLRDSNHKKVATGIYFIEINAEKELKEIRKITVVK